MNKKVFDFNLRISNFIVDILTKEVEFSEGEFHLYLGLLSEVKRFRREGDILRYIDNLKMSPSLTVRAIGALIGDIFYEVFEEGGRK